MLRSSLGFLRFLTLSILFPSWCLAGAGLKKAEQPTPSPTPRETAPDSPRAAVRSFLALANKGNFQEAAQFLDLPPEFDGPLAAKRLKAVLDRHLWIDLKTISPAPEGSDEDGLAAGTEEIGTIPGPNEQTQSVRLVRRDRPDGARWVFSRATVSRVDWWYENLPDRWLRERLPNFLFRMGARGLLLYQWIAVLLFFPILILVSRFFAWALQKSLLRAAAKTETPWDDALVRKGRNPVALAFAVGLAFLGLPMLGLNVGGEKFVLQLLAAFTTFTVFWMVYRLIDVATDILSASAWAKTSPSASSVLSLGSRGAKVTTFALGALAAASQLGLPVGSALAGLGLGGLAFALAAQKTVENLFGSVSIGVDQPFRVGDFINVGGIMGTVEAIGLRSTRIRTLDRTLVTMPNGKLADREIETFGARDRFRLNTIIALEYRTTPQQLQEVLEEFRRVLRSHPNIWPDIVTVRFQQFGQSSLDIEVMAWFLARDFDEFRAFREEVLLQFMSVVEKAETGFAFPSRTIYVAPTPGAALSSTASIRTVSETS